MNLTTRVLDLLEKLFRSRGIEAVELEKLAPAERSIVEELLSECCETSVDGRYLVLQNPVELLMRVAALGVDPERFVPYIEWKEFEDFIARVFESYGFEVVRGYRFTGFNPFELDVLAIDVGGAKAVVVECKHWRSMRGRARSLYEAIDRHVKRLELVNRYCEWIASRVPSFRRARFIIPVIVTLRSWRERVVKGVAIVPLYALRDFVANMDSYVEELGIAKIENKCFIPLR